jgi:hypothetical protein
VRSPFGRRVRDLFGITIVALAVSGNASAATCVTHAEVCQTLVIQATGPLRVYVQALSCIAASGLSWDVRVTDGSDSVRVPTESSPTLVPGRQVGLPHAGRWWLDVRLSNTDPDARCVQGESTSDRVTVKGVSTNPTPAAQTPRPASGRQQSPPPEPGRKAAVLTAQSSSVPEPSPSAITALNPATLVPPSEGDDSLPQTPAGSGGGSPLVVLILFAFGVAGVELAAFAIRRELRFRRQ